jgi:hypothetical protein
MGEQREIRTRQARKAREHNTVIIIKIVIIEIGKRGCACLPGLAPGEVLDRSL